jgi:energy-coupling factor transporter transmembrane protein EcfT
VDVGARHLACMCMCCVHVYFSINNHYYYVLCIIIIIIVIVIVIVIVIDYITFFAVVLMKLLITNYTGIHATAKIWAQYVVSFDSPPPSVFINEQTTPYRGLSGAHFT